MSKSNFQKTVTLDSGKQVEVSKHSIAGEVYWGEGGRAFDSHQEMVQTLEKEDQQPSKTND